MIRKLVAFSLTRWGYAVAAAVFVTVDVLGFALAGGVAFVQGWGGGIAAVLATYYLVFKRQGYWAWMVVNASLWTALFFDMGLPMLAFLQVAIVGFSAYGAVQWALVRFDIGFRPRRRSDVVGAVLATCLVAYSVVAYVGQADYAWTTWWALELGSVLTAIVAMWMDAYRLKLNWFLWTASNCLSAPLFLHLASWGPFWTLFAYQALNVVGYLRWRREERALRGAPIVAPRDAGLAVSHA